MPRKRKTRANTIIDLDTAMEYSTVLGAPIEGIPEKAHQVIKAILPILVNNTRPREAAIVMAVVYLYFSAMLLSDDMEDFFDNTKERSAATDLSNAKALLDAALDVVQKITLDPPME